MEKKHAVIICHEKLGEFTFEKINDGQVKFDIDKAKEILIRGIKYLSVKKMLEIEEHDYFHELLETCKIEIKKDLGVQTSLNYQYNRATGILLSIDLQIDEFISQRFPEDMISNLLDVLCQIIVKVKYPVDIVLESERYESTAYGIYGEHWLKYAEIVLPEEEVLSCKLSYKALNYFTYRLSEEQKNIFKE